MGRFKRAIAGLVFLVLCLSAFPASVHAETCEHQYVEKEEAATCTKGGVRYYECTLCGYQYGHENTDALGHDYSEWTVTQQPGCETVGQERRKCSRCESFETREIQATGHSYKTEIVEPTCEKDGYTLKTCTVCGDTEKTDYTDKLGHTYKTEIVEPTCEKDGYTLKTCTVCGDTEKTDYTDKLGHSYKTEIVEPTCEKDGYTLKTCTVCGDTEKTDYTDKLGHSYKTEIVEPTCEKDGYTLKTCTVCGATEKTDYTDKLGHSYKTEVIAPSCTKDGYTLHSCTVCGDTVKTDVTEKTGHHYDDGVVTKEATTTAMGRITYTCQGCGDTYTETTPKLVSPFADVKKTAYYFNAVLWAVDRGITSGTDETHFSPDNPCTRAQVVTFLWRAMGSPEPKSIACPFVDVSTGSYYRKAVLWAAEQGITSGVDSTHFGPNNFCTRAQVVTFLYRAKGSPEWAAVQRFSDVKRSDYFYLSVCWASDNGITSGVDGDRFGPHQGCTRAQIVTFLYKAYSSR